jgi:hypothetical protein
VKVENGILEEIAAMLRQLAREFEQVGVVTFDAGELRRE